MMYERAVPMVVGLLLALTQPGATQHATVVSSCSGGGGCGTSAAQSQSTSADGTITGECAYLDPQGRQIKIAYRQTPDGQLQAESDPILQDPVAALSRCKQIAESAAQAAQQSISRTQQQLFEQQQQLQEEIFRQNQALQQQLNSVPFTFFNRFNIPGFGQL